MIYETDWAAEGQVRIDFVKIPNKGIPECIGNIPYKEPELDS